MCVCVCELYFSEVTGKFMVPCLFLLGAAYCCRIRKGVCIWSHVCTSHLFVKNLSDLLPLKAGCSRAKVGPAVWGSMELASHMTVGADVICRFCSCFYKDSVGLFEGVCSDVEKSCMHGSASFPSLFHLAEVFVFHTQFPIVAAI